MSGKVLNAFHKPRGAFCAMKLNYCVYLVTEKLQRMPQKLYECFHLDEGVEGERES